MTSKKTMLDRIQEKFEDLGMISKREYSADLYERLWKEAAASAYQHVLALQDARERFEKETARADGWERRWNESAKEHNALVESVEQLEQDNKELVDKNVRLALRLQEALVEKGWTKDQARCEAMANNIPGSMQQFIDEYAEDDNPNVVSDADEEAQTEVPEVPMELMTPRLVKVSGEEATQQRLEDEFWAEDEKQFNLENELQRRAQSSIEDDIGRDMVEKLNAPEETNVIEVVFMFDTGTGPVYDTFQIEGMDSQNVERLHQRPKDRVIAAELVVEAARRLKIRGPEWFEDQGYRWFRVHEIDGIEMAATANNNFTTRGLIEENAG